MTEAAFARTNDITAASHGDKPVEAAHGSSGLGSWVADAASSAWASASGGARVAGAFVGGVAKEVYEHPGNALVQAGAGAVLAASAVELGVGTAAVTAAAAVPLAGYAAYKGFKIAATEGVGAIPGHLSQTWEDVKKSASDLGGAISTIYSGKGTEAEQQAAHDKVEEAGRSATPFAVGAAGGVLGAEARAIAGSVSKILPPLTLEPELALAGGSTRSGAAAATATIRSSGKAAEGAALGSAAVGETTSFNQNMSDYDRQQLFVEGRVAAARAVEGERGLGNTIGDHFNKLNSLDGKGALPEQTALGPNITVNKISEGWYQALVHGGPAGGTEALFKLGDQKFAITTPRGGTTLMKLPQR